MGPGSGEGALLQSVTMPSAPPPAQVKAFGPGLEPTGCIVDKPAEFTIDARAAGKGDLNLYAQVGHCPVLPPHCPGQEPWGGGQGRGRGNCNIIGLTLMDPEELWET